MDKEEKSVESILRYAKAVRESEEMIQCVVVKSLRQERFLELEERYKTFLEVLIQDLEALASMESKPEHDDLSRISERPQWLSKKDHAIAWGMYNENKLKGVKYLRDIAVNHVVSPLRWSSEFLASD